MVGWPLRRDITHIICAFCRVGGSNHLPLLELKLPLLNYFMKEESIFNITCFNDVKVWVEQSVLINIYTCIYKSETFYKI